MNSRIRREIFTRFRAANPHPTTELEYNSPFELLVAVTLSAQATDKSVNLATRKKMEKKKAANRARARYQLRLQRLEREKQGREERLAKRTQATATVARSSSTASLKKVTIQAALERARAARAQASPGISEKEGWSDRTSDISSR